MEVNSLSLFRSHWIVWKILGINPKDISWKRLYSTYKVILHLVVTVWYPVHLGICLFRNSNLTDDIRNLTIFLTCLACSVKFVIYAYNFNKIHRIEEIIQQLDSRVIGTAQRNIHNQLATQLRNIVYVFIGIYLPIGVAAELSFLFQEERALMYPAWFPFDWKKSNRNYYLSHMYQIIGISYLLLQNFVNDCFPAAVLCLMSSHIKMLYERFAEVGFDDAEDPEDQLEACITDHKRLLELFQTVETFISVSMLIQFAVTGVNVCISVAGVIFLFNDPMTKAYYFFYAAGIILELFPICYYGTDIQICFGNLHYAAFRCNWIKQNRSFKKKLMLFVERSLKGSTPMAGGMLRIHIDTFFSTLKFAYSMFTILIQMRK
ncbi:odorant receptor 59a [Drosophila grimshawi]|nr:odorant receptor 59a [Drosophila grimshawi]